MNLRPARAGLLALAATLTLAPTTSTVTASKPHAPGIPVGLALGVTCSNDQTHDTAALLVASAVASLSAGTVQIAAGTCALSTRIPLHAALTINGAGPQATYIIQHANANIFQITAPGVTVENVNLDTATYNPGPAILKNPKPAVLFSNQSHTTIRNVTAVAGSGFGLRITGPSPCASYQTQGTVVDRLTVTNNGRGGFAALDIDCTNGALLSNIAIHGDYVALYQDENVSLTNETYTPDAKPCQAPWYITGAAANIAIDQVQSAGGHGISKGPMTNVVVTNQTANPVCP